MGRPVSDSETIDIGAMLRESVSRLFADHVTPALLAAAERGEWPEALWRAAEEAGLTAALLPEAAGGFGAGFYDALTVLREVGASGAPIPLAETMLSGWLLAGAGLAVPAGHLALIAGSDLDLIKTDGTWRLTGVARQVAWGRAAKAGAALVDFDGEALVVLLPAPVWRVEPATNIAGEPRDTLHFDCEVASESVVKAPPGIGQQQLHAAGAVTRALMISGALERITAMTAQYANERSQFGKPIGRFQAIQQSLAALAGQSCAATAAAELGALAFADALRLPPIAAAKSRAGEAAGIGASIAHQIHGAIGFTFEHQLHFLTRRLWSWRDEYGGEAEWNALLGGHVGRIGPERLWAEITTL